MAYSEIEKTKITDDVCDKIANGKSMRDSLKEINISWTTFSRWIEEDEEKRLQYARAMSFRADYLFQEIIDISDTPQEGVTIKKTLRGTETEYGDMINHRRLQIDTRKWALSKMNPKKYGDKLDVTTDGDKINVPIIKIGYGEKED